MAFLVCLPIAGAIAYAFDKKIEEGIPVAMFLATIITYLCGIFDRLSYSTILVLGLAVLGAAYTIYGGVRDRSIKRYLTFGGVTFLLLCVYYGVVCQGRMLAEQDDLLVYGKQVSDFFQVDRISRYQYIPGMMLWEYLSEKMWPVFSESILFWAVATICISMMLAIFSDNERKSAFHYVFVLLLIVMLPIITKNRDSYFVLQNDFVMGVNIAYVICMYQKYKSTDDRFYKISVVSGLIFLTLTKVTGLFFSLIIIALLLGLDVIDEGRKVSIKSLAFVLKCFCAVVLTSASWEIFVKSRRSMVKFSGIRDVLVQAFFERWYLVSAGFIIFVLLIFTVKHMAQTGNLKAYITLLIVASVFAFVATYCIMPSDIRNDSIKNFANIFFTTYAPDRYFGFGYQFYIPYAVLFILLLFIWKMLVHISNDFGEETRKIIVILNTGFLMFTAFLYLSNYLTRDAGQTARAKECERYLYAYVICFVLVIVKQITLFASKQGKIYKTVICFLTVFIILIGNTKGIITQVFAQDDFYNFDGLNYITTKEGDKFFYVDQVGELNYSRFDYRISPAKMINYYFSDMKIDGYWLGNDEAERYLTIEEWEDILKECTYVYVAATNEEFEDIYGSLFEDEIIDGHIYNVITEGDTVSIKSIEY